MPGHSLTGVDYERLLVDNLGLVDQVIRTLARRHRLSAEEAEELGGAIRLKLVDGDYDVLRRFEGRCSLRTYLTAVVHRVFLDQRNARWGKWRPSLDARRHGEVAVLLERLLTRDGIPFDQAVETLRTNHAVRESREELHRLSLSFPRRAPRRFVGDEALEEHTAAPEIHDGIEQQEDARRASAMSAALAAALDELGPQDRLILKLRFQDEIQIAQIARLLGLEQKPLYRRIEHVMGVLRRAMEARGIRREDIEAIGSPAVEFDAVVGGDEAGNPPPRPSLR